MRAQSRQSKVLLFMPVLNIHIRHLPINTSTDGVSKAAVLAKPTESVLAFDPHRCHQGDLCTGVISLQTAVGMQVILVFWDR